MARAGSPNREVVPAAIRNIAGLRRGSSVGLPWVLPRGARCRRRRQSNFVRVAARQDAGPTSRGPGRGRADLCQRVRPGWFRPPHAALPSGAAGVGVRAELARLVAVAAGGGRVAARRGRRRRGGRRRRPGDGQAGDRGSRPSTPRSCVPLTATVASGNGARPNSHVLEVTGTAPVTFAEFAARTAPAWK
jgi:hypothetical protein